MWERDWLWRTDDFLSEWQQSENGQLEDLNTERNSNESKTKCEAQNDVQQGKNEASKDDPAEIRGRNVIRI